jgi:hypothetical protein
MNVSTLFTGIFVAGFVNYCYNNKNVLLTSPDLFVLVGLNACFSGLWWGLGVCLVGAGIGII